MRTDPSYDAVRKYLHFVFRNGTSKILFKSHTLATDMKLTRPNLHEGSQTCAGEALQILYTRFQVFLPWNSISIN